MRAGSLLGRRVNLIRPGQFIGRAGHAAIGENDMSANEIKEIVIFPDIAPDRHFRYVEHFGGITHMQRLVLLDR